MDEEPLNKKDTSFSETEAQGDVVKGALKNQEFQIIEGVKSKCENLNATEDEITGRPKTPRDHKGSTQVALCPPPCSKAQSNRLALNMLLLHSGCYGVL
ncbi:Guanylate cyclase soluble subunit beta-2 [Plecturocebus cupreus]